MNFQRNFRVCYILKDPSTSFYVKELDTSYVRTSNLALTPEANHIHGSRLIRRELLLLLFCNLSCILYLSVQMHFMGSYSLTYHCQEIYERDTKQQFIHGQLRETF